MKQFDFTKSGYRSSFENFLICYIAHTKDFYSPLKKEIVGA
jgi:hypothetical protein